MPEIKESAASLEKKQSKFGKSETKTLTLTRRSTIKSSSQLGQGHRSTINASVLPGAAQWEAMMRKFSEAHKESCVSVTDDLPLITRSLKTFPTGSTYDGTWNPLGMSGQGTYTFPHKGVVYKGGFDDGAFHGDGDLFYENGSVIKGKWNKGKLVERHLFFAEGLEYAEEDWAYCRPFDRRFTVEYDNGLEPAHLTYKTADQPPLQIPPDHYDVGYGFYDTATKSVYKYNDRTSIQSSPDERVAKWIQNNCRSNPFPPVGPCPFLYEQWMKPTEKLVPEPRPVLRIPTSEYEERESEDVVNVVTGKTSDAKPLPKHRPKGELFASRIRLNDFYDPNFVHSKADMDATSRNKLVMELSQSQHKVEIIEDENTEIDLISPIPSYILKKRPSVGFNLREPGSVSQTTATKQDFPLEEKSTSIRGLKQSDLNESAQKRIKTERAEELKTKSKSKDSLFTPSSLRVYERDSEDQYRSAQVSVAHIMNVQSEGSVSTADIPGHSKHTHVLEAYTEDSGADGNTQDLVNHSEYPQNAETLEGDQTQDIEQNVEQTPDIKIIEASAQDPTVAVNIDTQDNITQLEHNTETFGENERKTELVQDPNINIGVPEDNEG